MAPSHPQPQPCSRAEGRGGDKSGSWHEGGETRSEAAPGGAAVPPPCSRWRRCPCLGSCEVEEPFGKFVSALLWGSQSQDLGLRGKGKVTNRCRDAFMCQACASEIRNLVESAELHGPPLSFCTPPTPFRLIFYHRRRRLAHFNCHLLRTYWEPGAKPSPVTHGFI